MHITSNLSLSSRTCAIILTMDLRCVNHAIGKLLIMAGEVIGKRFVADEIAAKRLSQEVFDFDGGET